MRDYLRGWNLMRLFRLLMGLIITIQGWVEGYWIIVGLGLLFVILSLFNMSTCNATVCNTRSSRTSKGLDEVTYEEVK